MFWTVLFPSTYHIEDFIYIAIIIYGWICASQLDNKQFFGGKYIKYTIILLLISELLKCIFSLHITPLSEMNGTLALCSGLSVFFILCKHNVDVKSVIAAIVVYSIIGFILQYGENYLNFPVLFGVQDADIELRSRYDTEFDILGIHVCTQLLPIFCIYVFWRKYIETGKWLSLIPIAIFTIFLYLLQNRQTLISVVATFLFTPLLSNGKNTKKYAVILFIATAIFLVEYSDVLFGSMIENTNSDDVSWQTRMIEIPFFLKGSIDNPLAFLFGHGIQSEVMIEKNAAMWAVDVGFIGQLYQYGIFFVLQYFMLLWQVFRCRKILPFFAILYFFSTAIHSLFIFPYTTSITGFLWCVVLFYVNKQMESNQPACEKELYQVRV